jgi:predicted ATPase
MLQGWALAAQGRVEAGIDQMSKGLRAAGATGGVNITTLMLASLAEAHGKIDQNEEGLRVLAEALALVDKTEERFWEAEIHRLKGELLLQLSSDNAVEAESCYQKALSIAQNQEAKSLELRAATSLAQLWQSQNKRQEAHDLLAPVYNWFQEGFDTADLIDAKALLDELS